MATITEDYCSKDLYKLLIRKGFDGEIHTTFDEEGYTQPCITHQTACKWLRKKYNIVISINPQKDKYSFTPWQLRGSEWVFVKEMLPLYDKYEFACDAAIKYCLENLI